MSVISQETLGAWSILAPSSLLPFGVYISVSLYRGRPLPRHCTITFYHLQIPTHTSRLFLSEINCIPATNEYLIGQTVVRYCNYGPAFGNICK